MSASTQSRRELPPPMPFGVAPEVQRWRDQIKANDDAAHPVAEPFGQRLRLRQIYEQDLARARADAYGQGYRAGVANCWRYAGCAHLVAALLGAAVASLGLWAFDLVRAWL